MYHNDICEFSDDSFLPRGRFGPYPERDVYEAQRVLEDLVSQSRSIAISRLLRRAKGVEILSDVSEESGEESEGDNSVDKPADDQQSKSLYALDSIYEADAVVEGSMLNSEGKKGVSSQVEEAKVDEKDRVIYSSNDTAKGSNVVEEELASEVGNNDGRKQDRAPQAADMEGSQRKGLLGDHPETEQFKFRFELPGAVIECNDDKKRKMKGIPDRLDDKAENHHNDGPDRKKKKLEDDNDCPSSAFSEGIRSGTKKKGLLGDSPGENFGFKKMNLVGDHTKLVMEFDKPHAENGSYEGKRIADDNPHQISDRGETENLAKSQDHKWMKGPCVSSNPAVDLSVCNVALSQSVDRIEVAEMVTCPKETLNLDGNVSKCTKAPRISNDLNGEGVRSNLSRDQGLSILVQKNGESKQKDGVNKLKDGSITHEKGVYTQKERANPQKIEANIQKEGANPQKIEANIQKEGANPQKIEANIQKEGANPQKIEANAQKEGANSQKIEASKQKERSIPQEKGAYNQKVGANAKKKGANIKRKGTYAHTDLKEIFECNECGMNFLSSKALNNHFKGGQHKAVLSKRSVESQNNKGSTASGVLGFHERRENCGKLYVSCPTCGAMYSKPGTLDNHSKTFAKRDHETMYLCSVCNNLTKERPAMEDHVKSQNHGSAFQVVAENNKKDNSFFVSEVLAMNKINKMFNFNKTDLVPMCDICLNCYPTILECLKHMKKCHKVVRYTLGKVLDRKSISVKVDFTRGYCSRVKKSLFDMKKYNGKGMILYNCPVCGNELCNSLKTVLQHYRRRHGTKGEMEIKADALLIEKSTETTMKVANNVTFSDHVINSKK